MLTNILSSLGITEEESQTYTALLEMGPTKVGTLAKKMGRPRPSLYGFLKRLGEKGLVKQSSEFGDFGARIFYAEPPEKITMLFRLRIEELEEKQKQYKNILLDLEKTIPSKFLDPKFQLYSGEKGLRHVLKDMLLYSNIETQAFWPIKEMLDILSADFFRYLNKERIKYNIYTRAIWPKSQVVDIKTHPYLGVGNDFKREIRIAPETIDFSMGYWIYQNKVAFISSRKESFGFIIESRELVEMLLAQFELIWKLSKVLQVNQQDNAFIKEIY